MLAVLAMLEAQDLTIAIGFYVVFLLSVTAHEAAHALAAAEQEEEAEARALPLPEAGCYTQRQARHGLNAGSPAHVRRLGFAPATPRALN